MSAKPYGLCSWVHTTTSKENSWSLKFSWFFASSSGLFFEIQTSNSYPDSKLPETMGKCPMDFTGWARLSQQLTHHPGGWEYVAMNDKSHDLKPLSQLTNIFQRGSNHQPAIVGTNVMKEVGKPQRDTSILTRYGDGVPGFWPAMSFPPSQCADVWPESTTWSIVIPSHRWKRLDPSTNSMVIFTFPSMTGDDYNYIWRAKATHSKIM